MARNSGGTFSLPAGNPVVSGTPVASTWANTLTGDLSTAITDSLDRNGKGGMLAALRGVDGTVSAPAVSFTSETGTGWYRAAAGVLAAAISGVQKLVITATSVAVKGGLLITDTTGGKSTTLVSPTGLAADQSITFPSALPASTLPVYMSSAGVLSTRAVGQQVSSSSGNFTTASASLTDVTNLTVTITTTGRPVMVLLQSDGSASGAALGGANSAGTTATTQYAILRASTVIARAESNHEATGATTAAIRVPPGVLQCVDVVAAGTYTYKVQIANLAGTAAIAPYCVLVAFEL